MNQQAPNAQRSDNLFRNGMLTGIGIGSVISGLGGYFFARKQLKKKAKEDCKKAYKRGYDKGEADAVKDAQEVIDEIQKNTIVVDSDSMEDIQKAIQEHESKTGDKAVSIFQEEIRPEVEKLLVNGVPHSRIADRFKIPVEMVRDIYLKMDKSKFPAHMVEIIENKEQASKVLNEAYEEALIESEGDPENWDLSIDGEDARQRSEERERYLDLCDKYQRHPEDGPMHISRKEFEEECYLEKDWVTYYAGDNVFASDHDADNKMDAVINFGVTDGNELFATRYIDDEGNDDPNITYIRNFKMNTVYEITRTKGSHAAMMSGEVYLDGNAGVSAGGDTCPAISAVDE